MEIKRPPVVTKDKSLSQWAIYVGELSAAFVGLAACGGCESPLVTSTAPTPEATTKPTAAPSPTVKLVELAPTPKSFYLITRIPLDPQKVEDYKVKTGVDLNNLFQFVDTETGNQMFLLGETDQKTEIYENGQRIATASLVFVEDDGKTDPATLITEEEDGGFSISLRRLEYDQFHLVLGAKIISFRLKEGFDPKGKTLREIRDNLAEIIVYERTEQKTIRLNQAAADLSLLDRILGAAAYAAEPEPTVPPTNTPPLPTSTSTPVPPTATPEPTATPTPEPTIPLEGVSGLHYPNEAMVKDAFNKFKLENPVAAEQLKFEVRPNLNDPNKTPIVFGRDPKTGDIILATRMNQQTKEFKWHVAGLQDLGNVSGIDLGIVLDGKYEQFLGGEFDLGLVTSSWGATVQPNSPDAFNFDHEDYHINTAKKYGINKFRLGLVMGHSDNTPKWLREGNYSKQEAIDFMKNYIKTVMTRYKGVVKEYIVVNEPYGQDDILLKLIGPEYVEIAFQTAREIDPSAILILNETENHRSGTDSTNRTLNIIRQLKQKGLVDKVGAEMHIGFNEWSPVPTKEDVTQTFISYGIPVAITEFDYNLTLVNGDQKQKFDLQGQVYEDMVTAALNSGVCQSIGFWGVADKESWYVFALNMPDSKPNMWDDNYQPKPAYFGVYHALSNFLNRN